jgi:hypothetical protein
MKNALLSLLLILSALHAYPQAQTFFVRPIQTDPGYIANQDSHAVCIDPTQNLNKLLLFITGTRAGSNTYTALRDYAAELGWDVIVLSYPDSVAAASLSNDQDSLAFDHFRQEICYGTPVSQAVTVDSLNSISTRFLKLLQYLAANNTDRNWYQYMIFGNSVAWSQIAVAGHSQGSGHAAYLAISEPVDRVLMFSGPNDYSDHFMRPGNWLRNPGITGMNRHFSYLSLHDEAVDYAKQLANVTDLGLLQNDDSTLVDNLSPPFSNSHALYTEQTPGFVILNHNVPVKNSPKNRDVWDYMLSSSILTNISETPDKHFQLSPNPASGLIKLENLPVARLQRISIFDTWGRQVMEFERGGAASLTIDIAELPAGLYFVQCGSQTKRMLKQ